MAIMVTPKLANLPDVTTTTPSDGQVLTYDDGTGQWVNEAVPAGVTDHGALTGLGDDDHTQYVLADGSRAVATSLTLQGTNVTGTNAIGSVIFKNNTTTVARISAEEKNYGGYDDADLVFYTALNGGLTEKFRIPRSGGIVFPDIVYWDDTTGQYGIDMADAANTIRQRFSLGIYSNLTAENYAFFSRGESNSYLNWNSSLTNTTRNLELRHKTSGTPAAGFGAGILFQLETTTTNDQDAARISAVWSDATHATRTGDIVFSTVSGGAALSEKLRLTGAGILKFSGTMGNSTKVPGTDAPADWVQIDIGGTTYYLPAYAA